MVLDALLFELKGMIKYIYIYIPRLPLVGNMLNEDLSGGYTT